MTKLLFDIYDWLQKNLRPPSAFSWETLILLSLFSYYMSVLATDYVRELLVNFAWIFLILGVFWGTNSAKSLRFGHKDKDKAIPLSPWITGALVSIYLFGRNGEIDSDVYISWPIISATIAALPAFFGNEFQLKVPSPHERQRLVLLFGTQFLLSCWIQFYFLLQGWASQYPSMLADDFSRSAFVVKRASDTPPTPRGAAILNAMETQLIQQLNSKPWSEVERSLLPQQRKELITTLAQQAKQQIAVVDEDSLWAVTSGISAREAGYNLELRSIWQGPRSERQPSYSITKSCQISQVLPPTTAGATTGTNAISLVECEPVRGWGVTTQQTVQATVDSRSQ